MAIKTIFSTALYRRRDALHLTQEQVAEAAEMTVRAYQYLEKGERQPRLENFIKLSLLLGLTMEDFREGVTLRPVPRRGQRRSKN